MFPIRFEQGKKKSQAGRSLCFIVKVFHNIFYAAIKNFAEHVDGMGADTFVPLKARKLSGADFILLDQCVLGYSSLFHHFPKIIIGNHSIQPPSLLDIITDFDI